MPRITFVTSDGEEHQADARKGMSVMEAAVSIGVPDIQALCGGACSCATCHVIVDPEWAGRLAPATTMEDSMLEFVEGLEENSRLSCQIPVTDQLDGLRVRVPAID